MTLRLLTRLRRLEALRVERSASLPAMSAADLAIAARRYEASLEEPDEPDAAQGAYLASTSIRQLAADYDQVLRGGPAPWAGR